MSMRINPNYSLIERSPSPPPSTENPTIVPAMDSEKQAIQPTEEQASLSAPAANPAKTEEKPLTFDQKRELQSILQSIPLTLPPHLKKNVRRRRNANYARVAIFFTLWLIQSAYVFKEIFNSLYKMIKGWTVKGCAHKAASTVVAAATTSTRDNTQIWVRQYYVHPLP
jgi:hypothetical protein